jgi:hypothetical protein
MGRLELHRVIPIHHRDIYRDGTIPPDPGMPVKEAGSRKSPLCVHTDFNPMVVTVDIPNGLRIKLSSLHPEKQFYNKSPKPRFNDPV